MFSLASKLGYQGEEAFDFAYAAAELNKKLLQEKTDKNQQFIIPTSEQVSFAHKKQQEAEQPNSPNGTNVSMEEIMKSMRNMPRNQVNVVGHKI